ncbi:TrkA family protein [Breoghania corrubedonensis]|uniref:TrkA family protein n=1 Tax=Breoghania corrubedonensis TaxID=665038 RepID=A0A2T5VC42_9HYPH|nr:SLC13 family permease [Breoghania corrubedonensis]PTW61313.1 TrkA family protein [Breoghania corrubedonensis]
MTVADIQMALTFAVIAATILLYAWERFPIELTALGSVVAFVLIFTAFPLAGPNGQLGPTELLMGFANPALITIMALLVVGQALFHTDALDKPTQIVLRTFRRLRLAPVTPILIGVAAISAFLNNTPVVVMFLPVLAAVAAAAGTSAARVLMPLSFIAILGGMTTLIGSSTNLLVADVAGRVSHVSIGFFSFTPLGGLLAFIGSLYIIFVMPRLLKPRKTMADEIQGPAGGKQFIAQIPVTYNHPLVGARSVKGMFPTLRDMTVRLVQRGEKPFLPPFEGVELQPGDTVIVAATRQALTKALSLRQPIMRSDHGEADDEDRSITDGAVSLAEAVVAPGSRMIGRTTTQSSLKAESNCVVMGLQRRSRMPRMAMTDIRLEAGDVLLLAGVHEDIQSLRGNRDVLLMDWSTAEVPKRRYAPRALLIFVAVVAIAASGMVPIVTAAITGALTMMLSGCLNVRQALRALDSRIFMLIGASLAAATALERTGGAQAVAEALMTAMAGQPPAVILSMLFLLIAALTNVLSNNATAVLFAPIAVNMAARTGVDVNAFVTCLIFAANCSFATPIGYQTNLIVMGPGHYRFSDFLRAGTPLVLIIWLSFSLLAPWYYGF